MKRGVLREPLDQELKDLQILPELTRWRDEFFEPFMQITLAHMVMMVKTGNLTLEIGREVLNALRCGLEQGPSWLPMDPGLEDLFFNIEEGMRRRFSQRAGDHMQTARSRNDLYATAARLVVRKKIIELGSALCRLRKGLLSKAREYGQVIMPGYTHLQQAQTITFGHYLLGCAEALDRDSQRLIASYQRVNLCPLGAGALAGTSFQIDRALTARLLGFEGLVENSVDAIAARDCLLEPLAALSIMANNLSRMGNDLYLLASAEFGMVSLPDTLVITSSMMPQKRNPVTLEYLKAKCSRVEAAYDCCWSILKSAPFGQSSEVTGEVWVVASEGLEQARDVLDLGRLTIDGLQANRDRMLAAAEASRIATTDLAEWIVQEFDVPFRQAHELVAVAVGLCEDEGIRSGLPSEQFLNRGAELVLGHALDLPPGIELRFSPRAVLEKKASLGSPSSAEISRMLKHLEARLEQDCKTVERWAESLAEAGNVLDQQVDELLQTWR